ncbi:hypothetical protein NMY22_g15509 [Coprinellus aureogranulatus]|nr:hypothetical protein NMY22_g15509 [Coprinellus aureogranulatus]
MIQRQVNAEPETAAISDQGSSLDTRSSSLSLSPSPYAAVVVSGARTDEPRPRRRRYLAHDRLTIHGERCIYLVRESFGMLMWATLHSVWTTAPSLHQKAFPLRSFRHHTLFNPPIPFTMPHPGHYKRQDPLEPQTADGIVDSAKVVDGTVAGGATGLSLDAGQTATIAAPNALPTLTVTKSTPTLLPSQTESIPPATGTVESASAASSPISMKTVVGACVGAFIGAAAFILLSLFFYRRYSQSLKRKANTRRMATRSAYDRNSRADQDRRRSKLEPWDELKDRDMEDKWEGMPSTPGASDAKEMKTLSPAVYQNSPSGSSYGNPDSTSAVYQNHPYATAAPPKVPEARELLGREPHVLGEINSGPPISWAASDSNSSFLSSTRMEGGAMSPTMAMAIPTPPAQKSQLHRWESAEVVHISDGESAEIVDQHIRQSSHNPFFSAVEDYPPRNRTRTNTVTSRQTRSRSSSNATIQAPTAVPSTSSPEKEKKPRVVSIDPFRDPLPKPKFIHHVHGKSSTSSLGNDRAIRQLVAAASLHDLSEDEVQRRLRVASMQPSIISDTDSMYTDAQPELEVDDEVMSSFPAPPSSSGHDTVTFNHK